MSRSIRSALRARSTVGSGVATGLPAERHRDRAEGSPGRARQLQRAAYEGELVLLLGRELLHPDDLHDLSAGGREHVAVNRQEPLVDGGEHLESDRVPGDAHGAGLLAEVARAGEPDPGRVQEVAVVVRPRRHAAHTQAHDVAAAELDALLARGVLEI